MKNLMYLFLAAFLVLFLINCGGNGDGKEQSSSSEDSGSSSPVIEIDETTLTKEYVQENYDQVNMGQAPDFIVYDLNGVPLRLHDFENHVILLHFWSSNINASTDQFSLLTDLYNKYRYSDFTVLGVCAETKPNKVEIKNMVDYNKISYPLVFSDNRIFDAYGITDIPSAIVIDRQGNVVSRFDTNPEREKIFNIIELFL